MGTGNQLTSVDYDKGGGRHGTKSGGGMRRAELECMSAGKGRGKPV